MLQELLKEACSLADTVSGQLHLDYMGGVWIVDYNGSGHFEMESEDLSKILKAFINATSN